MSPTSCDSNPGNTRFQARLLQPAKPRDPKVESFPEWSICVHSQMQQIARRRWEQTAARTGGPRRKEASCRIRLTSRSLAEDTATERPSPKSLLDPKAISIPLLPYRLVKFREADGPLSRLDQFGAAQLHVGLFSVL